MRRLFPPKSEAHDYSPDEIYTVPELNLPPGVPLDKTGANAGLRPYIYFNMVSSVDGKTVTVAKNAVGLGSSVDFHLMGRLRLAADAVLVGAETFRQDTFVPDIRPNFRAERLGFFPDAPDPIGVVLSRDGNLPLDKKFFEAPAARRVVFLTEATPPERVAALRELAQVFLLKIDAQGQPDLAQMLAILYQNLKVQRLLCEGGATLNYALLSRGFGDELFWTLAPKVVGGSENQTMVGGPGLGLPLEKLLKLKLVTIYEENNELFMRYQIEH